METVLTVLTYLSFILAGAVVALNGIAAARGSKGLGKLSGVLEFVHDKVLAVVLPFLAAQVAASKLKENK